MRKPVYCPQSSLIPESLWDLLFAWLVPGDSSGTRIPAPHAGDSHRDLLRSSGVARRRDCCDARRRRILLFHLGAVLPDSQASRPGLWRHRSDRDVRCVPGFEVDTVRAVHSANPRQPSMRSAGWDRSNAAAAKRQSPANHGSARAEMLRSGEVPFGVFLGACSLLAVFWGERAWSLYLAWAEAGLRKG